MDPVLPAPFDMDSLEGKTLCKRQVSSTENLDTRKGVIVDPSNLPGRQNKSILRMCACRFLQLALGLDVTEEKPLVVAITRLVPQKVLSFENTGSLLCSSIMVLQFVLSLYATILQQKATHRKFVICFWLSNCRRKLPQAI